jgi:hypothetical protein
MGNDIDMPEYNPIERTDAQGVEHNNGQSPPESIADADRPQGRRRSQLKNLMIGALIGSLVGLIAILGVVIYLNRGQIPMMKPAELEAAASRWNQRGPASYSMDLEQLSDAKEKMHVEVRNGEVTSMTFNGQPSARRLWSQWTVPGLFEFIRIDLRRNEEAEKHAGGSLPQPVLQQAEFDADGLPSTYRRTELSSDQVGGWRIVAFRRTE